VEEPDAYDDAAGPAPRTLSPKVRRRLRVLAFIVIPALFIGVLAVGLIRTEAPKAKQGSVAPDFSLDLVGGGTLSSNDLKGSPVVINFWASWCVPCQQEASDFEATWKQYQSEGVRVVGVNYEDSQQDAQAFLKQYGITYPSVRDTGGDLATKFGVRGVPETFFIDTQFRFFAFEQGSEQGNRSGTRILGAVSRPKLKADIDSLLAYTPPPASPAAAEKG